jgi:hypothetical protein
LWVLALFFVAMPLLICGLSLLAAFQGNGVLEPGNAGEMVAMGAIYCQAGLLTLLSPWRRRSAFRRNASSGPSRVGHFDAEPGRHCAGQVAGRLDVHPVASAR